MGFEPTTFFISLVDFSDIFCRLNSCLDQTKDSGARWTDDEEVRLGSPGAPHHKRPDSGRAEASPISIRLTQKILKKRKRVFNELLRNYGVYTVKTLGEFDREIYILGLDSVLERAQTQSDACISIFLLTLWFNKVFSLFNCVRYEWPRIVVL